mmetsp:Transcript_17790/g.60029  ORF Transcript_17790/g.60029 Transcript_17790/m.60029 type:complete len:372 (+) Transcript_17790:4764-5879(+)
MLPERVPEMQAAGDVLRAGTVPKVARGLPRGQALALPALLLLFQFQAAHHPVPGLGSDEHEPPLRDGLRRAGEGGPRQEGPHDHPLDARQGRRGPRADHVRPAGARRGQHRRLALGAAQAHAAHDEVPMQRRRQLDCGLRDGAFDAARLRGLQFGAVCAAGDPVHVDHGHADRLGGLWQEEERRQGVQLAAAGRAARALELVPPGPGGESEPHQDRDFSHHPRPPEGRHQGDDGRREAQGDQGRKRLRVDQAGALLLAGQRRGQRVRRRRLRHLHHRRRLYLPVRVHGVQGAPGHHAADGPLLHHSGAGVEHVLWRRARGAGGHGQDGDGEGPRGDAGHLRRGDQLRRPDVVPRLRQDLQGPVPVWVMGLL